MKLFKVLLATLALVGLFATSSYAADATLVVQPATNAGVAFLQETDNSLHKLATITYFVNDDAATVNIDTGTEACANIGMDCVDVYTLVVAGASGDELLDVTCATDNADGVISLAFCN